MHVQDAAGRQLQDVSGHQRGEGRQGHGVRANGRESLFSLGAAQRSGLPERQSAFPSVGRHRGRCRLLTTPGWSIGLCDDQPHVVSLGDQRR